MKIIKAGSLDHGAYWIDAQVTCQHCGTIVEFTADDEPTEACRRREGNGVYLCCPTCSTKGMSLLYVFYRTVPYGWHNASYTVVSP